MFTVICVLVAAVTMFLAGYSAGTPTLVIRLKISYLTKRVPHPVR